MLIIIEGPDNTGKTTLARHLQEVFSLDYIHCSKPKTDNPYLEYCELADSIKKPTVIDRAHLGEYVYGTLWRGGCSITPKMFQDLDLKFMEKFEYVVVIHAQAPLEIIEERCKENNEQLLKPNQIAACSELFYYIMSQTHIPVVNYHSDKEKPEDVVEKLCQMGFDIG